MSDSIGNFARGIFESRRFPAIAIVSVGFIMGITFFSLRGCSGASQIKSAKKLFGESKYSEAISELDAYLEENPDSAEGWLWLGRSHKAMAKMTGDPGKFREHACAAINAYKKRLAIGFHNNINNEMIELEERTQDMVDSEGRLYGGCEDTEASGPEGRP